MERKNRCINAPHQRYRVFIIAHKQTNKIDKLNDNTNLNKTYWKNFPTMYPFCRKYDASIEKMKKSDYSKWKIESIKAYGNAVVPQLVYQIFNAINDCIKLNNM